VKQFSVSGFQFLELRMSLAESDSVEIVRGGFGFRDKQWQHAFRFD
jgi:hypothetical protein